MNLRYKNNILTIAAAISITLIFWSCETNENPYQTTDREIYEWPQISTIEPQGWILEFLKRQKSGLTGNPQEAGYPFDTKMWMERIKIDATTEMERDRSPRIENFQNGGENDPGIFWWPYEQTGYYIDGAIKAGYILNDQDLIKRGKDQVYHLIENPLANGTLGPGKLIGRWNRWPYAGLFRAFITEYEQTNDQRIIEAMHKHYLNHTAEDFQDELDVANVEAMCWLFEKTGDSTLLNMAEESYRLFKSDFKNRTRAGSDMIFESDRVPDQHGVVYFEVVKIPALLYLQTGNEAYLEEAIHGLEKVEKHFMLPSGHPSTTEHFKPVNELAGHETCNYGTLPYTYGILLKATGNSKWADKIEKSAFNAALGAITKDFRAHQYFSAPNQVIATHESNHFGYYKEFMAYNPGMSVACCTGNINRFMPYYTMQMWLKTNSNGIAASLYGPSSFSTNAGPQNKEVTIKQETKYPFEEAIDFEIETENDIKFDFELRIPGWCKNPDILINGASINEPVQPGSFHRLSRKFNDGDVITLSLPMDVSIKNWPNNGVSFERGPLVFSLPVDDSTTYVTSYDKYSEAFPAYALFPNEPWAYSPHSLNAEDVKVINIDQEGYPWDVGNSPIQLQINARAVKNWHLNEVMDEKLGKNALKNAMFPKDLELGSENVTLNLVPYGSTLLRVTMFPSNTSTQ